MTKLRFNDMTPGELDQLIQRVQDAIDYGLCLEKEDLVLLLEAFRACLFMQEKLANNDLTMLKLKKLLGMVQSSEKLSGLLGGQEKSKKTDLKISQTKKKRLKKVPDASEFPRKTPEVQHHRHDTLKKGQSCPECCNGKLYKYMPSQFTRIKGESPFLATVHISERLKCNKCEKYYTARLPTEVTKDGDPGQKYGYSARALMAIFKFFGGYPLYRQESLQKILGISITASTQFDQIEYVANDAKPIYNCFLSNGAPNAPIFNIDDTRHKILDQKPVEKKKRNSDKTQLRTGVYCSGLIATLQDGNKIVLFKTNIGHAGEFIDEVLSYRNRDLPPPLVMSDALSSNKPSICETQWLNCNVHGRRQFYDLSTAFRDEALYILGEYGKIFDNEEYIKAQDMSQRERLNYHRINSLPIMKTMFTWCKSKLSSNECEENSGLGKACKYMLNHRNELIKFCELEGAHLDNNSMEAMLKIVVLGRKNYSFFKTAAGAAIANVLLSIIATAHQAGINIFDYLTDIQRYRDHVKANPEMWFPWNYRDTLTALNTARS